MNTLQTPSPQTGQAAPAAVAAPAIKPLFRLIPVAVLVLGAALTFAVTSRWDERVASAVVQTTNNAYVQADATTLNARASGYVRAVHFQDFQHVAAGTVLAELEDDEYRAALARAEADLQRAQAQLLNLGNEVAAQKATIEQTKALARTNAARLALSHQEYERFRSLSGSGAVTEQETDNAKATYEAAQATQQGQVAAVDLQQRQLDVLAGQKAQREAAVASARASVESAAISLRHTHIVAPVDGTVGNRAIQLGGLVNVGNKVANFVPDTPPYIIANFKETQLSRMRAGQHVDITVDSFPGRRLRGVVASIAPASGNTFSLVPADNATGNFTKVVQRVPVRITLAHDDEWSRDVRAGMSVEVAVDTGRTP